MYEVADTCIIGPHDNTVKNQSDEEILTLLTCANKEQSVLSAAVCRQ